MACKLYLNKDLYNSNNSNKTYTKFWNYAFIHKATGQFLDKKL